MDDEELDEFFGDVERPSTPFRPMDALVLIVDFIDDLASALHSLTSKLLWKVAAHSNHTFDQERARDAANSGVEII